MGLLDRNKRKPAVLAPVPVPSAAPATSEPAAVQISADGDSLRDMLIATVATGDMKLFEMLATANRSAITANFAQWQMVPEPIRENGGAMRRYANMLIATAELFRDRFSDPSLINRLTEPAQAADPVHTQWEQGLKQADALMQELRFDEAAELFRQILAALQTVPTGGPVPYHAVTHGRLGSALFARGELELAANEMWEALQYSMRATDRQGIAAGLRGLFEIHRYMGKFAEAADFAVRLSEQLAKLDAPADAEFWTRQAARVRAGEPLCRVVFFVEDRQCEVDEVPVVTDGRLRYGFVRNRPSLALCDGLMHRAMQLGQQAKFDEALEVFAQAAKADPFDPNPHYQAGVTLMHLQRAPEALEAYDTTERLAPGWFNCRGERWVAGEIAAGRLPHPIFFVLRTEDMPDGSLTWDQKLGLVDQALAHVGPLAPLSLYRARCLIRLQRAAEAIPVLREGLDLAKDADTRTRILVDLQMLSTDPEEKRRLLTEAITLDGNLAAIGVARVALRHLEI